MIFVAAGTQDGRELAGYLLQQGYEVTASVVSQYGESLLQQYKGLKINSTPLDEAALIDYFQQQGITLCVDASHPYAANVSQNAMSACEKTGIPYIRYERSLSRLDYSKAHYAEDYQQAAKQAAQLGDCIFLTTGSRNLAAFARCPELQEKRLVCRILPETEVLGEARELGFSPGDIVAMQGPFSLQLNKELFLKYGAQVVVTKNSGTTGGTDTKFAAAMELGLPLVIIDRPQLAYTNKAEAFPEVLEFVRRLKRQGD